MSDVREVRIGPRSLEPYQQFVAPSELAQARDAGKALNERLAGSSIWNINSTERGGGVAEMLRSMIAYARGLGVDVRWGVISGTPEFFRITKRLHNALHGNGGDGTPFTGAERKVYEQISTENATELMALVRPGDIVIAHDPQTAGLIEPLTRHGVRVVWRCHIGSDETNLEVTDGWAFLAPYLRKALGYIFTRSTYVPDVIDRRRVTIIPPSIDPLSAKNQPLSEQAVRAILRHVGLVESAKDGHAPAFCREDGTPGRVDRCVDIIRLGRAPAYEAPLVVQVSRWDRLKDHVGVLRGFDELLRVRDRGEHLVLAGPNVHAVADDPEGAMVFDEVLSVWRALPHAQRRRVHLANLPMADVEENAAIVNALQRHASVVVQKSLREGFGLTVTEAMWKGVAVIASRVGGIQDQIEDGASGVLVSAPKDIKEFAQALACVLDDEPFAARLGERAIETVREKYLNLRSLTAYAAALDSLLSLS